jgi:fibronectin-binding autotransporter adhesin
VVPSTVRSIRPSASTAIAIDGGEPTGVAAPQGDLVGDVLNLDISAVSNATPVIVSSNSPGSLTVSGIQPFTWTQIEDMNLVDQGKLTNVQLGDLFARATPGADLIQFMRNPVPGNPNGVRVRVNTTVRDLTATNKTILYAGGSNDYATQSNVPLPAEFYGEDGDDYLSGALGNDWLSGGLGNDQINASGGDNILWGDNAPTLPSDPTPQDQAVGGNDSLSALSGNDVFYGGGGDDQVSAGPGNDYIHGGQGDDTLDGNDGDDRIYGSVGNDILGGQNGHDLLSGGGNDDQLLGSAGNDVLIGGTGADSLDGGGGDDVLISGSVANESSSWTSVASTTTYSPATYRNLADNDAALLTLLSQWASSGDRSSLAAITHDGANDDLWGSTGNDDFAWESADVLDAPPMFTLPDFNAPGMGSDERFGPT